MLSPRRLESILERSRYELEEVQQQIARTPRSPESKKVEDHPRREDTLEDEQLDLFPSRVKMQALFEKNISSAGMEYDRIPVEYRSKNLEVLLTSKAVNLQACMIPKDHCSSAISTAADLKFFLNVV